MQHARILPGMPARALRQMPMQQTPQAAWQQAGMGKPRFELRGVDTLEDRIRILQELVWEGLQDPDMRRLALQITSRCEARDDLCELAAIYAFNKKHIRYSGDIAHVDTFQTWRRSLDFGAGDCDDALVSNATAAAHNGFMSIARVTTSDEQAGPEHIICVCLAPREDPRHGIALDTTLPDARLGDEPDVIRRYWDFPLVVG